MSLPAGIHLKTLVINPTGTAGSAAGSYTLNLNRAGIIRALEIVNTSQPATMVVKLFAESATGPQLFTTGATNTAVGPAPLAFTGVNQANGAVTVVSVASGGAPFKKTIVGTVATGDPSVNGAKPVTIRLWVEY